MGAPHSEELKRKKRAVQAKILGYIQNRSITEALVCETLGISGITLRHWIRGRLPHLALADLYAGLNLIEEYVAKSNFEKSQAKRTDPFADPARVAESKRVEADLTRMHKAMAELQANVLSMAPIEALLAEIKRRTGAR